MWRWAIPALSKTPDSRSNRAFLPPKARRARSFASCCSMRAGGTAVARERRLQGCMIEPITLRAAVPARRSFIEYEPMTLRLMQSCGRSGPRRLRSRDDAIVRPAVRRPNGRSPTTEVAQLRRALGDGLSAGQRGSADQHGAGHRKGRQALAGRRGYRPASRRCTGVPPVKVAGQGGLGDVVAASRFRRQPARLSELCRAGPERHQRRGARLWAPDPRPGRAAHRRTSRSSGGNRRR